LLFSLDSFFIELPLLLGLFFLGLIDLTSSTSSFFLRSLSFDLLSLSGSGGGLDDGYLGFSLGFNG
jgi:hypothetical protein